MPRHSKSIIQLVREENIKIFAEIGVLKGVNLRNILRSDIAPMIEEYWAIDPWVPYTEQAYTYLTSEQWHAMYTRVCKYARYFKQLRPIRLTSTEAATIFPDEYFDMVYIDAHHIYPAVSRDIKVWLPKVKIGGILGGHDFNLQGVRDAVHDNLTGVWDAPHQPGRRGLNVARTLVWLKRREE